MDDVIFHNSQWGSPEPKVVVQKLSIGQNSPQKAHLSWLGWTVNDDISQERPEKPQTFKAEGCHHRSRVRRRLISDEPRSPPYVMEDDEPLAQILDEQLFPEIGNSDDFLKSPPNVDFLLGSVTPKSSENDWDAEKTLKDHRIDIFGNEDDREEFTDFCETLMAGPSGDSLFNNQAEMEYPHVQSPQSNSSHVWDSEESDLQSFDDHNHYGTYENPKLVVCDALLLHNDQQESSDFSINSCSPYISPAFSYVTSPEFCSQDHWTMARRNRRWKKTRLGLRACDALYFDGEKYVSIKVITDGTKKYRLVIPKSHKHSKGMPEDVAIFTATLHESL